MEGLIKSQVALQQIQRYPTCGWPVSEWLRHFSKRCDIAKIVSDEEKINTCFLYVGTAGEGVLEALPDGSTWADAEAALIREIGRGTAAEEAWEALKVFQRKGRSLLEVGKEIERLAKLAFPGQVDTQERQGIDTFLRVLPPTTAAQIQQLGHGNLKEVIKAARRIEQYPIAPQSETVASLQARLSALEKKAQTPSTPTPHVNYAQPTGQRLGSTSPASYRRPGPYRRPTAPQKCYLCDEEGHLIAQCPWKEDFKARQRAEGTCSAKPPAPNPVGGTSTAPTTPPVSLN